MASDRAFSLCSVLLIALVTYLQWGSKAKQARRPQRANGQTAKALREVEVAPEAPILSDTLSKTQDAQAEAAPKRRTADWVFTSVADEELTRYEELNARFGRTLGRPLDNVVNYATPLIEGAVMSGGGQKGLKSTMKEANMDVVTLLKKNKPAPCAPYASGNVGTTMCYCDNVLQPVNVPCEGDGNERKWKAYMSAYRAHQAKIGR